MVNYDTIWSMYEQHGFTPELVEEIVYLLQQPITQEDYEVEELGYLFSELVGFLEEKPDLDMLRMTLCHSKKCLLSNT
jgi:hypothetical protein